MMSKIVLIAILILFYPIFRVKYRKIYIESGIPRILNFNMLRPLVQYVAQIGRRFSSKKHSPFMQLFLQHFHAQKGAFRDQNLRKKVYDLLYKRLSQGSNYKSLYRIAASDLNPSNTRASNMNKDELAFVQKYFQMHFKHPDNL